MTVITRFAPSPTGFLHIGSARTALFNYLFARHNKGKFLLRIEDTDKERSTKEATEAIFAGLKWLGLDYDDEVIFQASRNELHKKAALDLLAKGKAYYCFTSQEEIAVLRSLAIDNKEHFIFKSPWRDVDPATYPKDVKPVIRLKAPRIGITTIHDKLQGEVVVENSHLDDMVLLRRDGTATYMLAVVVDDNDMKITHIIRGDDHLTNAARQILLYEALSLNIPVMVHIPLIHGEDGAKLSKRHGALGVDSYREMGYLPEALCNYLLRLGWGHKDDEIISKKQAIDWFGLEGLGKSPARLDFAKMKHLNAHYLRELDNEKLASMIIEIMSKEYVISDEVKNYLIKSMDGLKLRAELIGDLTRLAKIYLVDEDLQYSDDAKIVIANSNQGQLQQVITKLDELTDFNKDTIQATLKSLAESNGMKIGDFMLPIRARLTGMTSSPSVFEIMAIIGKKHTIDRLSRLP